MPSISVPEASAALTANGGATGYVTVADNTPFYPGCIAWLSNTDAVNQRCLITDLSGTTLIGIRFLPEENDPVGKQFSARYQGYGRSNCSAFTVAKSSRISMSSQLAPVEPASDKPVA
jgi:hypothetical protein